MTTIKNIQVLLYYHFNKIIKGPGTSFPSAAFSLKTYYKCFSHNKLVFDQISF